MPPAEVPEPLPESVDLTIPYDTEQLVIQPVTYRKAEYVTPVDSVPEKEEEVEQITIPGSVVVSKRIQ